MLVGMIMNKFYTQTLIPMPKEHHLQVSTNKSKSDTFGEVFTPIWLVDSMLERVSDYYWRNNSCQNHAGFIQ